MSKLPNPTNIRNIKIELIGATPELYDTYYKFRCDKGDIFWTGYLLPPDYERMRLIYLSRCRDSSLLEIGGARIWIVRNKYNSLYDDVGYIMLINKGDYFEYAHSVLTSYRGQGIATIAAKLAKDIAFRYTNTICAFVRDDNIASQKVFEKNGYTKTDDFEELPSPALGILKLRKWECRKSY